MIIYLHGFASSPASSKVQLLKKSLARQGLASALWCDQLPVSPAEAIARVESVIHAVTAQHVLIGSSLGGYYATYLAEKHGLNAILLNPATQPFRTLLPRVGLQTHYQTGEVFEFTSDHLEELRAFSVPVLSDPSRYWLIVETGDKVLDYRDAVAYYAGARQTVMEGGNHNLQHFPDMLDEIESFALSRSGVSQGLGTCVGEHRTSTEQP